MVYYISKYENIIRAGAGSPDQRYMVQNVYLLCCIGVAFSIAAEVWQSDISNACLRTNYVIVQANTNIVDSLNLCVIRHIFSESCSVFRSLLHSKRQLKCLTFTFENVRCVHQVKSEFIITASTKPLKPGQPMQEACINSSPYFAFCYVLLLPPLQSNGTGAAVPRLHGGDPESRSHSKTPYSHGRKRRLGKPPHQEL